MFWIKWREDFLNELQSRQKWCIERPNLKPDDIILVKDKGVARNDWPLGIVEQAIKSEDKLVRKAVYQDFKRWETYFLPTTDN